MTRIHNTGIINPVIAPKEIRITLSGLSRRPLLQFSPSPSALALE
jgi:hypothetical protein